ncbi:MAG: flagellar brake domain-containing protein [Actinobacteria bacterium]|nr:flagellar brake domain-containing protein [Actinomycetota bacterium]
MTTFRLNQKIYVSKPENRGTYISAIEKIEEKKEIAIALPLSQSSSLPVRIGDLLTIRVPSDSSSMEFTTSVKQVLIENVPVYVLEYPDRINRVQLRKHVRVNILLDIQYSTVPRSGEKPDYRKATALDISAGGMKISVPGEIGEGETLLVAFELPVKAGAHSFELETRVMRSFRVGKAESSVYQLGLLFTSITAAQRDMMFNYIFSRMAGLRRDGKA